MLHDFFGREGNLLQAHQVEGLGQDFKRDVQVNQSAQYHIATCASETIEMKSLHPVLQKNLQALSISEAK